MLLLAVACIFGCSSGGGGAEGNFLLIEFLESGQNNIPRNRTLTFRFSAPVATVQDFAERLKIQNVQTGTGQSDFSRAIGFYIISGDVVLFVARLPVKADRADSGFRANANYHVFVKGGPDALVSTQGDRFVGPQEHLFDTNEFFEDTIPTQPPRVTKLLARDITTNTEVDISRLDPRPLQLGQLDSNDLITAGSIIEPGAGGAPNFDTRWQFELHVSEPLDPQTVTEKNVEMFQIREDALTGTTSADPGTFGDAVNFRVPIRVEMVHDMDALGNVTPFIRVTMVQTLVDDARYRIVFSGNILGLDFRKQFIGENGLTGDGQSQVSQLAQGDVLPEPGGLGYTSEFVIFDRPAIAASRTVTYNPLVDGILPETGQTTLDENLFNSALYNPASDPGKAVGFLAAFGDGEDGDFAVSGNNVAVLDTGDQPNELLGNPFDITTDPDPFDEYSNSGAPTTGALTYDSTVPAEFEFSTFTVGSSATLRIVGVNACRIRVRGIVSITGMVDASGDDGLDGGGADRLGGAGGPAGGAGGDSKRGDQSCTITSGMSCTSLDTWFSRCAAAKAKFPYSTKGFGPGRGNAGGGAYPYHATLNSGNSSGGVSGTGGGGGSHAEKGEDGDDKYNVNGQPGTVGPQCAVNWRTPNSGVIGVRGVSGPVYGDRVGLLILIGGSGGGGGGVVHAHQFANGASSISGGSAGGGGGWLEIVASSSILINGGIIDVSGGDGGRGSLQLNSVVQGWDIVSGSGGGGAGGTINLISGANINLTSGILDASGGQGGGNPGAGTTTSCNFCNSGGDGGRGFIFLMDADGIIDGFIPNQPGNYDTFALGVLTISEFDATRFSTITAVTELFPMPAANPDYTPLAPAEVLGNVAVGQSVTVFASSSKADPDDPLRPDPAPGAENPPIQVATISSVGGGVVVSIDDSIEGLNLFATPDREAFVRIRGVFNYTNTVEAALGPFASIDEVTISCVFNG